MKRSSKRILTVLAAFAAVAFMTAGVATAAQTGADAAGSHVRPLLPAFGGAAAQEGPMGPSATPLFSATESSDVPSPTLRSSDGLHAKTSPSGVQLDGSWSWELWWTASTIDARTWGDRVSNTNTDYTTGTLMILLKAATQRPNWGDTITGYDVDEYQLGQLGPQQYFQNIDTGRRAGTRPPNGTYDVLDDHPTLGVG